MTALAPKQDITFKYVGTLIRYIQAPLHTQFVAGGAQVGRVEISARKWISKSSPLVPATYQGCLQKYWGHLGEGPRVWGQGPVFDPPFGKETTKTQGFGRDAWIAKLIFAMSSVL